MKLSFKRIWISKSKKTPDIGLGNHIFPIFRLEKFNIKLDDNNCWLVTEAFVYTVTQFL